MNPFVGLLGGPVIVAFGLWLLLAPDGWATMYDSFYRWWYRIWRAEYEGSLMQRALRPLIRLGGVVAIGLGVTGFAAGIILLAREGTASPGLV